jgi:hypothetical protein
MNTLMKHEVRHLLKMRGWEHITDDRREIRAVPVPKIKSELPRDNIPYIITIMEEEDRGWLFKGQKIYLDRMLAIRKIESGRTVLERNDERLTPIGKRHFEYWKSDL